MAASQPPRHKLITEPDIVASAVSGSELWRGECCCGGMVPAGPLLQTDVLAAHFAHITTFTGPTPHPGCAGPTTVTDVVAAAGNPRWRAIEQGGGLLDPAAGESAHTLEFGAFGDLLDIPRLFTVPLEPSTVLAMVIGAPTGELIVAAVFHPATGGEPGRWNLRTHAAGAAAAWRHRIDHNPDPADPTTPLLALTLPNGCTYSWWLGFRDHTATTAHHAHAG